MTRLPPRSTRTDTLFPYTTLFRAELPDTLEHHAGCVIFGGPMSANDDHLPFIRQEIDFIPKVLKSGTPFLGVCLGAQLLARAGGAAVGPHAEGWHEIGYYPVKPTAQGRDLIPADRKSVGKGKRGSYRVK